MSSHMNREAKRKEIGGAFTRQGTESNNTSY